MSQQTETEVSTGLKIAGTIVSGLVTLVVTCAVMIWAVTPSPDNTPTTASSDDRVLTSESDAAVHVATRQTNSTRSTRGAGSGSYGLYAPITEQNPSDTIPSDIFLAAECGTVQDVERFVSSGADINQPRTLGWTPLHLASRFNPDAKVLECLISHGANVNVKNSDGQTPFDVADTEEKKRILRGGGRNSDASQLPVPSAELEGTWRQYVNGSSLADFTVKFNRTTGQYEMSLINRSGLSTGTRGITNIQFDGRTWSFDSDWGYKIAKFVLKKIDNNTFEGVVDGNSRNRWVRIGTSANEPNRPSVPLNPYSGPPQPQPGRTLPPSSRGTSRTQSPPTAPPNRNFPARPPSGTGSGRY
jgi:hypothetical protein